MNETKNATPTEEFDLPEVNIKCEDTYTDDDILDGTIRHFKSGLSYRYNKKIKRWIQFLPDRC